jgi:hypothetical protein
VSVALQELDDPFLHLGEVYVAIDEGAVEVEDDAFELHVVTGFWLNVLGGFLLFVPMLYIPLRCFSP